MSSLYTVPPNTTFYIGEIWAYISEDDRGNEGVCGCMLGGTFMAMVAADKARLDQLRPVAQRMARDMRNAPGTLKRKIKLVKFTQRIEVEEIR
jgi:hypothetical protein